jgi:hypothetical protein
MDKKTEVVITCNSKQPVAAVRAMETELKKLQGTYQQLVQAGKAGTERAKTMAHEIKELSIAIKEGKANMDKIVSVTNNLSQSSLSQLQRALRQVKKEMSRVSTDSPKLDDLRMKYKAITDQIKILSGEMLNIKKHIGNLSGVTDSWLQKAVQQQKALVQQTRQGTSEYNKQMSVLSQLSTEQARRAVSTISSGTASAEQLRSARAALVSHRDMIGSGGIQVQGNQATEIAKINEELKKADAQLDTIAGKEQKLVYSTQEIADKANQIIMDPKKFTPKEIETALTNVNNKLKEIPLNDPFRKQLKQSATQLKAILDGVDKELIDIKNLLQPQNLKKASLEQLKNAATQLEKEMAKLNRDTQEYINKKSQLATIRGEIDKATGSVHKQSSAWQTTLRNMSAYFGAFQLFSMAIQKVQAFFRLNLKFSDQLADIRKVSGLAMQDINNLANSLAKLDTRTTIQELNEIAYAGAKLGMGKYGTAGLEQFVRAANQVNVALKEDLGQDALTALSKITEVMGLIPKMGVEKSMLAVGSAMFQLSATSTATSNNIVEFSKRLTGMARTAGITTDQLLALGSASDAMYLMPEVASTAFNKLITSLQTKHNLIEQELQIEPGTINNLYSAGKTMDAIVLILEKMKAKGNMNALQGVFKDLGSEGARLVNVMVTMSKNVDMLKDHLATSEEAFSEATAVTQEYAIQQETANALMERASNIWEKSFINPKGVDNVKELAQQWYNLTRTLTESTFFMAQAKAAIWLLISSIKILIALLPVLIEFFLFRGAYAAIMAVVRGFVALRTAIQAATVAQHGLNAAQKANLFGLIATLIAAAVSWFITYREKAEDAAEAQQTVNHALADAQAEYMKTKKKLDDYVKALDDANISEDTRQRLLRSFNKDYRIYLDKLGIEVNSVNDLKTAYAKLNDEIKKKAYYELRERTLQSYVGDAQTEQANAMIEFQKVMKKYGLDVNADYVVNNQHLGMVGATRKLLEEHAGAKFVGRYSNGTGYKDNVIYRNGNYAQIAKSSPWVVNTPWMDEVEEISTAVNNIIAAYRDVRSKEKEVHDAFDGLVGDWDADFRSLTGDEPPGSLDNNAPDKDALRRAKEEAARQKKQWRDDLKEAQDRARAIIDNIKNFYQRQINEVLRTANEQNWDTSLTDAAVRAVEGRMNLALSNARKAIAGVQNDWGTFKTEMAADMREMADETGYNESQLLLNSIQEADPDAIRNLIMQLSSNLELPQNAAIDAIWKNASHNETNIETAEQKRRREVQKRLLDDNFTGKVDNEYTNSMETLGFFDLSSEQANTLLAGGEDAEALLQRRAQEIGQVLQRARETNLFAIQDKYGLMEALFGKDWQSQPTELAHVLELTGDDLQVFYRELIKYSDSYTEALKRSRERQKKILDEQWMKTTTFHANEDAQKQTQMLASGVGQFSANVQQQQEAGESVPRKDTYGTASFISSMGHDPEIDSYRLKMEAAAAYYDFLKAHQADAETLRDAEQAILQSEMEYAKSVAEQMKQRINDIYELAAPIEDFGTEVGEAFATMTEDAEEGRKAMKKAIGSMIKAFMKQTVEMSKEYIKRRMMQKMNDKLTSKAMKKSIKLETGLEQDKQDAVLDVAKQGGQARTFLNEEVEGDVLQAKKEIGNETLITQQTQTQQEVQTESSKTQANTTMGIASGASKIIGSLGWWGIPLIAVITALLNGLLSFAMSKVSSLFGGGKEAGGDEGPNVKLASGMLTYDSGNVQAYAGVIDGKTYPVVGSDGKVYAAKDGGELSTGLVKDPITTLINGQPALVAEKGPEMVIGRETTAAMMMARPDIIAEIVKFDKNRSGQTYRAYDAGNIAELIANGTVPNGLPVGENGLTPEDIASLRSSLDGFAAVMALIQKNGLHVNKFGRGSVTEASASGAKFMRQNSGDRLWRG